MLLKSLYILTKYFKKKLYLQKYKKYIKSNTIYIESLKYSI